jgi:hypothetical protein
VSRQGLVRRKGHLSENGVDLVGVHTEGIKNLGQDKIGVVNVFGRVSEIKYKIHVQYSIHLSSTVESYTHVHWYCVPILRVPSMCWYDVRIQVMYLALTTTSTSSHSKCLSLSIRVEFGVQSVPGTCHI